MIPVNPVIQWTIFLSFYLFFVVAAYQYFRAPKPYPNGLAGLIIITIIVVAYTVGKFFFPYSHFTPTFLPPVGLLWFIYYLAYFRRKRSHVLTFFIATFLVLFVLAYIASVINV